MLRGEVELIGKLSWSEDFSGILRNFCQFYDVAELNFTKITIDANSACESVFIVLYMLKYQYS